MNRLLCVLHLHLAKPETLLPYPIPFTSRPWFVDAEQHCNTEFDTFVVGCKLDKLVSAFSIGQPHPVPCESRGLQFGCDFMDVL